MDRWMDGWTDGRTDGWMDGWMDGQTDLIDIQIYAYIILSDRNQK